MGTTQMNDHDFMTPMWTTSPGPFTSADPTAGLSQETLRVSDEWLAGEGEKLNAGGAQFARGMAALLRENRRLTPRPIGRLVLLTSALVLPSLPRHPPCPRRVPLMPSFPPP